MEDKISKLENIHCMNGTTGHIIQINLNKDVNYNLSESYKNAKVPKVLK